MANKFLLKRGSGAPSSLEEYELVYDYTNNLLYTKVGSTITAISGSGGSSDISVANQSDNRLITASGTTDSLNAEANLTFDGSTLAVTGDLNISGYVYDSDSGNRLTLDDDSDSAQANQVTLASVNNVNILIDGTNNGTGDFQIRSRPTTANDLDTADIIVDIDETTATFDNITSQQFKIGGASRTTINEAGLQVQSGSLGVGLTPIGGNARIQATSHIEAGVGSGAIGLTINDGGGNSNVTFNHTGRVPEQNGNSGRIEVNTDGIGNQYMAFELAGNVTSGVTVATTEIARIDSTGLQSSLSGTAASPALRVNDSNTGLYRIADDKLGISTAGTFAVAVDASQNVGIGTSTPSYSLHVIGTGQFSDDVRIGDDLVFNANANYIYQKDSVGTLTRVLGINGSNTTYIGPIDAYSGGRMYYGASANMSGHNFYTGGTLRMKLDGYVLDLPNTGDWSSILNNTNSGGLRFGSKDAGGTLAYQIEISNTGNYVKLNEDVQLPATKKLYLDGGGNTYITEELPDQITLRAGGGNYFKVSPTNGVVVNDPGANVDFRVEGDTDQNLLFTDASTDRVGIGTSSPLRQLHLSGEGVIRLDSASADPGLDFNTAGTNDMQIRYRAASDKLQVYSYGTSTNVMTIQKANGYVGIGTESPAYELDVAGDIGVDHVIYHNGDGNTYHQFTTDRQRFVVGSELLLDLYEDGTQDYVKLGDGGDVDINLNDDMFVEGSSGNVGIGVSSPTSPLNIYSTDTDMIYLQGNGITSTSIIASDTGGSTRTRSAGGKFEVYTGGSANSASASGASVRLQIEDDGDIRMVVPDDKRVYFGVNNSASIRASSAGYTLFDNADGHFYIRNTVNGSNIYFGVNDGSTQYPMAITSTQRVGIGTTSPLEKLHIYETGLSAYKTYTSAGAGVLITSYQSQGNPYTKTTDIVANSDGTVPSEMRLFTKANGASSASERLRIDSSGNVGIGINSPTYKLDVNGTARFQGSVRFPDSIGATFGDSGDLQIFHNGSYGNITNGTGNFYIDNTTDDGDMYFRVDDAGTLFTAMRIDGSEIGNVHLPNDGQNLYIGQNNDIRLVHLSGTNYMYTYNGPFYLGAVSTDQDVFIRGNDGGASINAVQFDMSDAGTATFNHDILLNKELSAIRFGASQQGSIYEHSSDIIVSNSAAGNDTIFENLNSAGTEYVKNLFIDGSTSRIGIGTTSPDTTLDVTAGGANGVVINQDSNDASNSSRMFFKNSSGTYSMYKVGEYLRVNSGATAGGSSGGTNLISIGSNVGIGVASPSYKLDITHTGSGLRLNGSGDQQLRFERTSGNAFSIEHDASRMYLYNRTTSAATVAVTNAGNFGVGTVSPSNGLELYGAARNIYVTNTTEDAAGIIMQDAQDPGQNGRIVYDSGANKLYIQTHGGTGFTMDASRNIGIGTSSPSFKLKVNVDDGAYTNFNTIAGFQSKRGADTEYEVGIAINSGGDALTGSISSNVYFSGTSANKGNTGRSSAELRFSNSASNESEFAFRGQTYNSTTFVDYMKLDNTQSLHVDGDVVAYSTSVSDKRLKDNIKTIDNALDKVMALRGVEFDWNATSRSGQHDIGLIAQEVEEIIPEVVREKKLQTGEFTDNEKTFKTIDYDKMVGVLVEAIKEQQKQINKLEEKLNG